MQTDEEGTLNHNTTERGARGLNCFRCWAAKGRRPRLRSALDTALALPPFRACPRAGRTVTHTVIIYRLAQVRLTHQIICFMTWLNDGSVLHIHPHKVTFWPKVLSTLKKKNPSMVQFKLFEKSIKQRGKRNPTVFRCQNYFALSMKENFFSDT